MRLASNQPLVAALDYRAVLQVYYQSHWHNTCYSNSMIAGRNDDDDRKLGEVFCASTGRSGFVAWNKMFNKPYIMMGNDHRSGLKIEVKIVIA